MYSSATSALFTIIIRNDISQSYREAHLHVMHYFFCLTARVGAWGTGVEAKQDLAGEDDEA
jgi:hypothetical protein